MCLHACQKHFIYDAILWELNIKKLRTKHSNIWFFFLVIIKILTMNHPKICTNLKIYKNTIEITDVQNSPKIYEMKKNTTRP